MNQEKLKNVINLFEKNLSTLTEDLKVRKEQAKYYQKWTKEKIQNMTEEQFVEFIGKLWSMAVWKDKRYIADKIIEANGFKKIKKNLMDLLYGEEDIIIRWDKFYSNMKQFGPATMSELLSYINPNEYVITNHETSTCFRYLELENVPSYNYQYTGKIYKSLCKAAKDIKEKMENNGITNVDLLLVDYLFWDVVKPLVKEIASNGNQEETEALEKDENQFIHKDIINQLLEIGQWLGFESKSEVKVADGSVVDVIWQAQIGNMGKVIYAFEVQTKGSIKSLILNLQKATNNFAVQAVIAVSDETQLTKIEKNSKGLPNIESKLKLWNYKEVIEIHDCLEKSNQIINKLNLIPDSFI